LSQKTTKYKINPKINRELKNKTILITGGAGSIGFQLTKKILKYPVRQVRVLDINEHALFKLNHSLNDNRIRVLLGSILDKERTEMACRGVDIVFHTAAIKNIEISEFNPIETIETNINGTVNMIKTVIRTKPKKFLNISTDKAADPSTLYGTTKQLGERLTSWAGAHFTSTKFASIRFGNVFEANGNVFEIWKEEKRKNKPLSITDPNMKRYFFHVDEATDFILLTLSEMKLGEIFVPKMEQHNLKDLASKISQNHRIIGLRQGEKLEELLITDNELKRSTDKNNMWIIRPYSKM
jgi:UDP-N-acetylglucosamine 4,6-dehydratase